MDGKTHKPLTYNGGEDWKLANGRSDYIFVPVGTKLVTVGDLRDQINQIGPRSILYCQVCGAEYSASAGDYWAASKDYVFTCCEQPMALVFRRVSFVSA